MVNPNGSIILVNFAIRLITTNVSLININYVAIIGVSSRNRFKCDNYTNYNAGEYARV